MSALPRLLSTLGLAACALAAAPPAHALGHLLDLQIIDRDSGERLPVYRHRGEWWVAGRPGARYAIELRNASAGRLLGVTAVDGVNIVSGESAAWPQTGYVLAPGQTAQIAGWRKSDAEIAAFRFTALADSYAARTGRPHDVGVIGVAVFRERAAAPRQPLAPPLDGPAAGERGTPAGAAAPAAQEATAAAGPSTAEAAAQPAPADAQARAGADRSARGRAAAPPGLGTGHGEREHAPVGHTRFERRAAQPDELITLRYDSRENLIAAGIIAAEQAPPWPRPRPFPASPARYVPDPPARP